MKLIQLISIVSCQLTYLWSFFRHLYGDIEEELQTNIYILQLVISINDVSQIDNSTHGVKPCKTTTYEERKEQF